MIPALCKECPFKCETSDQYWGLLEGCANGEIEKLKAEIKACYVELFKMRQGISTIFNSELHKRVEAAYKKGELGL